MFIKIIFVLLILIDAVKHKKYNMLSLIVSVNFSVNVVEEKNNSLDKDTMVFVVIRFFFHVHLFVSLKEE